MEESKPQRRPRRDEPFSNEPLDVAGLPQLDVQTFESLDPNYLRIRLVGDAVFAVAVVLAGAVGLFYLPWWIPSLAVAALLALTGLTAWLQALEVRYLGYLVREKDFSFRSGVITRNVITVPFARVQHVSIDRGPLARYFGLATLQMRTAGDGLTVPGMSQATAARLKALVVDRAGALADQELAEPDPAHEAHHRTDAEDRWPQPLPGPPPPTGPTEQR